MTIEKDFGDVVPRWSPPFAPGPYVMDHWEGIIVELEVPREQIEYMTPDPLTPAAHSISGRLRTLQCWSAANCSACPS